MRQAEVIAQLRGRVRNLRSVVASLPSSSSSSGVSETGSGSGSGEDGAEDVVYKALCRGGPDVVQEVVMQLRRGATIEEIARCVE